MVGAERNAPRREALLTAYAARLGDVAAASRAVVDAMRGAFDALPAVLREVHAPAAEEVDALLAATDDLWRELDQRVLRGLELDPGRLTLGRPRALLSRGPRCCARCRPRRGARCRSRGGPAWAWRRRCGASWITSARRRRRGRGCTRWSTRPRGARGSWVDRRPARGTRPRCSARGRCARARRPRVGSGRRTAAGSIASPTGCCTPSDVASRTRGPFCSGRRSSTASRGARARRGAPRRGGAAALGRRHGALHPRRDGARAAARRSLRRGGDPGLGHRAAADVGAAPGDRRDGRGRALGRALG